jgi:hypothetical protein
MYQKMVLVSFKRKASVLHLHLFLIINIFYAYFQHFISQGPNWLWALDGHEKLAQPFALYIYGIIDTFSCKIISMKVLPDKKKDTVSRWLINEINNVQGKHFSYAYIGCILLVIKCLLCPYVPCLFFVLFCIFCHFCTLNVFFSKSSCLLTEENCQHNIL